MRPLGMFEDIAASLRPNLLWIGGVSVLAFAAVVPLATLIAVALRRPGDLQLITGLLLPWPCLGWVAACVTFWYHPQKGILRARPNAWFPLKILLATVRGWAAFVAVLFCAASFLPLIMYAKNI